MTKSGNIVKKYYVYIWYITNTNEIFYVGKGSNNRVMSMKDRNNYFKNIRNKYECDFKIIKYFERENDAYDFEKKIGLKLKKKGQAKACYVLGETQKFVDKKTRKKISKSLTGNIPWNKGQPMSLEQREKLRAAKIGTVQSLKTRLLRSISLQGQKRSEATRRILSEGKIGDKNPMFGKSPTIDTIEKRRVKMLGHFVSQETRIKIGLSNGKRVAKIDICTEEVIEIYNSASEAARENGINNSKISQVCRGVRKTSGGFKWKYISEN